MKFGGINTVIHALIQEFVRGSRPENGQKKAWTTFFFLSLFYSLQRGSNGLLQRNLYFPKDSEGVQHFPGGSNLFPGGPNAYFYR